MGTPMLPRPMSATRAGGRIGASLTLHLLEGLARHAERVDRGRHAAVDRHLQEHLGDLLLGDAVADGAFHVELQLVRLPEGRQHGEVEHAARTALEAGPAPDRAPAVFGDELLRGPVEVVRARDRLVDVLGSEDGAPDLEALLEEVVVHGDLRVGWPELTMCAACVQHDVAGGVFARAWHVLGCPSVTSETPT